MANPQIENGYTKIANELLDAFVRTNFSGEVRRIIDCVIRQTYGFNKTCDRISLSQFEIKTGMDRKSVCRAINKAVAKRTLLKTNNGLKLNKNYHQWVVAKQTRGGGNLVPKGVANRVLGSGYLATYKRNYTKEITKGDLKILDKTKKELKEKGIIK